MCCAAGLEGHLGHVTQIALLGRDGPLPFVGSFRGALPQSAGGTSVSWAGRVTSGTDPALGWRAARSVSAALARKGPVDADRRRALSILWARLHTASRDVLGPNLGDGLVLALLAQDAEGIAVSSVGLAAVWSLHDGVSSWIAPGHPMLSLPGFPSDRPGAVCVDVGPAWLVGVPHDAPVGPPERSEAQILGECGVWL